MLKKDTPCLAREGVLRGVAREYNDRPKFYHCIYLICAVNDRELWWVHSIDENDWCTEKRNPICLAHLGEVWGVITECKSTEAFSL